MRQKLLIFCLLFSGSIILSDMLTAYLQKHSIDGCSLEELAVRNNDFFGILSVDSVLQEPVVRTADNSYYLTHSFDRKPDIKGSVFVDSSCNESSTNLILYGHNNLNGTAFSSLVVYKDSGFASEHRDIHLLQRDGAMRHYLLAAVMQISADNLSILNPYLPVYPEDYKNRLSAVYLYFLADDIPFKGSLITLSTCDESLYGAAGRLVLLGVEIDSQ